MRLCLIPLTTEIRNPTANLQRLAHIFAQVEHAQPDLVCLPECALTGYLYDEDDFKRFAEPVPGPLTESMAQLAKTYHAHICFGLLETSDSGVYNSAVLLDRSGEIILQHRKIEEKPPFINGDAVSFVNTEFGRLGILICGDMFNPDVVRRLDPALDLLVMPMSRSFDGPSPDAARWISGERQVYLDAVKAAGVTTLIVNALEINNDDPSFGGALIVSPEGELLAESPHGTDEILLWVFAGCR